MSWKATFAVKHLTQSTGITRSEKFLMMILADYHNEETGQCDPAVSTLAHDALMSERHVVRTLRSLEKKGFLAVIRRRDEGRQGSNQYDLKCLQPVTTSGVQPDTQGDAQPDISPPSQPDTQPDAHVTLTERENRKGTEKENRKKEPKSAAAAAIDSILKTMIDEYQRTFGPVNKTLSKILREWAERLPEGDNGHASVYYAFREARDNGGSWRYVERILTRLEDEGWSEFPTLIPSNGADSMMQRHAEAQEAKLAERLAAAPP